MQCILGMYTEDKLLEDYRTKIRDLQKYIKLLEIWIAWMLEEEEI